MTNDIFNYPLSVIFLYVNFFFVIPFLLGYKYRIRYTTPAEHKKAMALTGNGLLLTVKNAIIQTCRQLTGMPGGHDEWPPVHCKSEN